MRWAVLIALAGLLLAAESSSAASVQVMVVGRSEVLRAPGEVRLAARTVRVGSRRCAVGPATPLGALLALRLPLEVKDYGACGRAAGDGGGLFVRRVGPDRNRGQDGWVYKVGRRAGTTGAADPAGAFGDGRRLRDGQRVVWFWCVLSASESCQRTLEISPEVRRVRHGEVLRVRVRGFDDSGRGRPVAGATVSFGEARVVSGVDGIASIPVAPGDDGPTDLTAQKPGTVPAFPTGVVVG